MTTGLEKLHTIATGVHQGTLALDPETARHYIGLFAGIAEDLQEMLDRALRTPRGNGFGTLHSGQVVEAKYHDKLTGESNSLAATLRHHLTVVRNMHLALERTVAAVQATDHTTAGTLAPGG